MLSESCDLSAMMMEDGSPKTSKIGHISPKHPIYKHYQREQSTAGDPTYQCLYCNQTIRSNGGSTSNLMRHLERKHAGEYSKFIEEHVSLGNRQPKSVTLMSPHVRCSLGTITPTLKEMSPALKMRADEAVISFITKTCQPLEIVDEPAFRALLQAMNSRYVPPISSTLKNVLLPKTYDIVKRSIVESMSRAQHVAVSCDLDVTHGQMFIAVTGHFVTERGLRQSYLLSANRLAEGTPDTIAFIISGILGEWGLKDRITCITTSGSLIANQVITILQLNRVHYPCMGHALQSVVRNALNSVESVAQLIQRCRSTAKFFSMPSRASTLIRDIQIASGATPVDIDDDSAMNGWSGAYPFLKRILDESQHINLTLATLLASDEEMLFPPILEPLSEYEIGQLSQIDALLWPFMEASAKLSGQPYEPLSIILPIAQVLMSTERANLQHGMTPATDLAAELLRGVRDTFGPYFSNEVLLKAAIIDPRFKGIFYAESSKDAAIMSLVQDCKQLDGVSKVDPDELCAEPAGQSNFWRAILEKHRSVFTTSNNPVPARSSETTQEIWRYLEEPLCEEGCDIYRWWADNCTRYPHLYRLSLRYLCGPATAVPSSDIFSDIGGELCARRKMLRRNYLPMACFIAANHNLNRS